MVALVSVVACLVLQPGSHRVSVYAQGTQFQVPDLGGSDERPSRTQPPLGTPPFGSTDALPTDEPIAGGAATGQAAGVPTHVVIVQPIICRDNNGKEPARSRDVERLVDQVYSPAGVDFHFLEPIVFDNTNARDGLISPDQIIASATRAGVVRSPNQIINMFYVNAVQDAQGIAEKGPLGVGKTTRQVFAALAPTDGLPPDDAEDAFVVAAAAGQSLGLKSAAEDPDVREDIPNLMGTGTYAQRVTRLSLNRSQIATIQRSPLVRPRIECLTLDDARAAILDDSYNGYFSKLQKREIAALTGSVVESDDLDACRATARRRFEGMVRPIAPRDEEALTWFAERLQSLLGGDFALFQKQPWRFIKVSNDLAGGFSHTRGSCIFFSERTIERIIAARNAQDELDGLRAMGPLFVHEQMHVLERLFPGRFEPIFQEFGFQMAKVESNAWLDERQILNPDAVDMNWVVRDGDQNWYNLRTLLRDGPEVPTMGRDFVSLAVRVRPVGGEFRVMTNDAGLPETVPLESLTDFVQRLPIENGFDHPNETASYLFQHIVMFDYLTDDNSISTARLDRVQKSPVYNKFRRWCRTNLN